MTDPKYPIEYFEVQVIFTDKLKTFLKSDLDFIYRNYTSFYRRITGNYSEVDDQISEIVTKYSGNGLVKRIYQLYLEKGINKETDHGEKFFGCFGFTYDQKSRKIILHMRPLNFEHLLAKENISKRIGEKRELFKYIEVNYPNAKYIVSASWITSLSAYQRLMPEAFFAGIKQLKYPDLKCRGDASWGQFLNSDFTPKTELIQNFKENVEKADTVEELFDSFPIPISLVLATYRKDLFQKFFGY